MLGGGPGGGSERELERGVAPLGPILLLGLRRHGTRGRPNAKISFSSGEGRLSRIPVGPTGPPARHGSRARLWSACEARKKFEKTSSRKLVQTEQATRRVVGEAPASLNVPGAWRTRPGRRAYIWDERDRSRSEQPVAFGGSGLLGVGNFGLSARAARGQVFTECGLVSP